MFAKRDSTTIVVVVVDVNGGGDGSDCRYCGIVDVVFVGVGVARLN